VFGRSARPSTSARAPGKFCDSIFRHISAEAVDGDFVTAEMFDQIVRLEKTAGPGK